MRGASQQATLIALNHCGRVVHDQMNDAYNPAIRHVEMPSRIRALPIHPDFRMPIPWFAGRPKGKPPDLRTMDAGKIGLAIQRKVCWICGDPLGRLMAFTLGPMCAITRTNAEPPSHRDCAIFAMKVCPFLVNPSKSRRGANLPDGITDMAGIPILRNPGIVAVWITRGYKVFQAPSNEHSHGGILFKIGDPIEILWFEAGQPASREAILHSINTGLPALREMARKDPHPDAIEDLNKAHAAILVYLPP